MPQNSFSKHNDYFSFSKRRYISSYCVELGAQNYYTGMDQRRHIFGTF